MDYNTNKGDNNVNDKNNDNEEEGKCFWLAKKM